jgi:hypothetical protein
MASWADAPLAGRNFRWFRIGLTLGRSGSYAVPWSLYAARRCLLCFAFVVFQ